MSPHIDQGHRVLDVRKGWLIIAAFLIQLAVIPTVSDPSALPLKKAVLALTALMLLLGILPNLRWWAFRVFAVGFLLNTTAMAANGGLMPITPENFRHVAGGKWPVVALGQTPPHSKNVLLAGSDTRLAFLTDSVYIRAFGSKVYSAGDLVLLAGAITFLFEAAGRAIAGRMTRKSGRIRGEAIDVPLPGA